MDQQVSYDDGSLLPPERVDEVQDFVQFLARRYGLDEKDAWSDEDVHDLTAAVFSHAERSL